VAATASSIAVVRGRLSDWLTRLGWPTESVEDIVLAVSEAVTNAVEHAYSTPVPIGLMADTVEVRGVVVHQTSAAGARRRVHVQVRDQGRWRPPPSRQPSDGPSRFRGHGLVVMRALMARVTVNSDTTGTEVELISRSVTAQHDSIQQTR
jgi:anti-sigma regulatory factor (Ser/Thr protein kinase)